MSKLKNSFKKLTAWGIMMSLLIGSCYWTDANISAKEKNVNFKDFITTTAWNYNGAEISGGTTCQFKPEDVTTASYEYEIPAGTVAVGADIKLPIFDAFTGTLVSSSSDKADVSIDGQMITIDLKENGSDDTVEVPSPPAVSLSGPAVDFNTETVSGTIVIEYKLHTGILGEEPYLEMTPEEINAESPNMLNLKVVPKFLTGIKLYKDDKEVELGTTQIARGAELEISYEFACANGTNLTDFEVKLPTEFTSTDYPVTELKQDGIILCEASVTASTVKFEFKDAIKDKTDIKGRFRFSAKFNKLVIGKDTSRDITFDLGNIDPTIKVNFIQPKIDPKYSQSSGEVIDLNVSGVTQKAIEWTQKITVGTNVTDKAVLTDNWKHESLTYVTQTYVSGSMSMTSSDAAMVAFTTPESTTGGIHTDGNGITYSVDNMGSFMEETTVITIKYKTLIAPKIYSEDTTVLKSAGKLTKDTLVVNGSSGNVTIKPQRISKFYTLDIPNKKVHWTYVINESTINMYHAVLTAGIDKERDDTDVASAYQTLDKIAGITIKVGTNTERILAASEYTVTPDDKGFTYDFANNRTELTNPLNQKTEIKFTTDISEEFFKTNQSGYEFKTNAKLKWYYSSDQGDGYKDDVGEWKDGANKPTGGNTIVEKIGIKYEPSTGIITWQVKVRPSSNGIDLKGVKLVDEIPNPQKYVPGSVKVTGIVITENKIVQTKVEENDVITIDLGDIDKTPVDVELQTKVPDSLIYDNINIGDIDNNTNNNADENEKVVQQNALKLTATDGIIGGSIVAKPANQEINSKLLRKKSVYHNIDHTIDWTIYINESKLPIKEAKIVDILPPEVSYVDGSFLIAKESSPDTPVGTFPGIADGTFTYDFKADTTLTDGTITDSYIIKYQTKITDFTIFEENQTYDKIENIVKLTGKSSYDTPEVSIDMEKKKKQPVKVSLAEKAVVNVASGKVVDPFIKWRITVNQDRMEMKNATISDDFLNLPGGLELDSSDMKLVKGTLDANGKWEVDKKGNWLGESIDIKRDDFTYDIATKQFVFKIPDSTDSAYQLFFTTTITDKTHRKFEVTNIAKFYNEFVSGGAKEESASCTVDIAMPDGDISSGSVGNVTVTEKENDSSGKILSGTEFAIFNQYGQVGKSQTTDNDGKVKFEDLTYDKMYTIKEIKPTAGYRDKTNDIPVKVTSSNKKMEVESYSEKLKTEISFKKVSETEDGSALAGAEFGLYAKDNLNVEVGNAISTAGLDANGYNITFLDVPFGDYQIKEKTVPVGYEVSSTPIEVTMSQDTKENNYGIKLEVTTPFDNRVFVNMTEPGDVRVKLVTKEDPNVPLANGKFEIYDNKGTLVAKKETDSQGELTFTGLYIKKYTIKQIEAPNKYIKSETEIPVTLELTDRSKSIVVENPIISAPLKVNVTSALRGKVVPGATFAIYYKTDTNFTNPIRKDMASDGQGNVDFGMIPYGEYVIRQEGTPEGFIESTFLIDASIVDVEEVIIPAINQEITGTVTINITDKVAGVEYTLYDDEGNVLAVSKTDKDGLLVFDNIVYGNHKLRQTSVPSGYESSNKEYDITIKEQNDEEDIVIDSIPKTPSSGGGNNFVGPPPTEEKPEEVLPEEKEEVEDEKPAKKPNKKPNKKPSKPTKPSKDKNQENDKNNNSNTNSGSGNHKDTPNDVEQKNTNNASGNKNTANSGANSTIGENTNNSGKAGETTRNSGKVDETLPQSGAFFDFKLLSALGISLILIGTAFRFKKKKVR